MGIYLNPGNSGFEGIRNAVYVDKSGLINLINQSMNTPQRLTCVSRPRRFGKSFAAQMLCAYYDKSCGSASLFEDLEIAKSPDYKKHLNQYDVIYLNMTDVLGETSGDGFIDFIRRNVTRELQEAYPSMKPAESFSATLVNAAEAARQKFIIIIDEWDAPIREKPEIERSYLEFLRALFKSSATTARTFAAVYMTGILPIKKDGSQSAISDFEEYTMLNPGTFAPYVGFLEEEVRSLCESSHTDFDEMKRWYDGYSLEDITSIYNPNSVIKAIRNRRFRSYWTETSAAGSLLGYIALNKHGLGQTVARLIGGEAVPVDINGFANDLITFRNQDDVLTLLIHLGYLAYNENTASVRIPNEEIRLHFAWTLQFMLD